jgi:broad specificity phosphatase PhoE
MRIPCMEDFNHAITKVWEEEAFAWPGGESNLVAQQRGVQALEKILREHKGQKIAIGTHGNIMVLIMNALNSKYGFEFWEQLNMPDIYKLSFNGFALHHVERIWKLSV